MPIEKSRDAPPRQTENFCSLKTTRWTADLVGVSQFGRLHAWDRRPEGRAYIDHRIAELALETSDPDARQLCRCQHPRCDWSVHAEEWPE